MSKTQIISAVYIWQNGMCMVFDTKGTQIGHLQGRIDYHLKELIDTAPADCQWHYGHWNEGWARPITLQEVKDLWEKLKQEQLVQS